MTDQLGGTKVKLAEELKLTLLEQWQVTNMAQERVWHAESKVDELETKLAVAKAALQRARAGHEKHAGMLQEVWTLVRSEIEKIPIDGMPVGEQEDEK